MAVSLKTFAVEASPSLTVPEIRGRFRALEVPQAYRHTFVWFQLFIAYVLLECALWSSRLSVRNRWALVAMAVVALFAAIDRPSLRRLGLGLPSSLGASLVLAISFVAALVLIFTVYWAGGPIPANATWPSLRSSWQYVIWALMQEFILQSFFFTRCEELFGSSAAVWVSATLFAAAHLPSPLLTTFTLIGGLFFCEVFRRYRSIYPIGIVHAALGLTIAMTMPDSVLHHMRVGIGYLRY
jgi:membrane protease YdiL (CAAX protease family)